MTTPAPPSREAEIAARLDNPLKEYATERQYQDDIRYLLAQLQQARQERDEARAALERIANADA